MANLDNSSKETGAFQWPGLAGMFLFTLIILAALHSSALLTAAYDLPEGVITEQLISGVEIWNDWMVSSGVSAIGDAIIVQMEMIHMALVNPNI